MRESDATRLRHRLEAAREAMAFAAGRGRADLDRDRMLALSLVRLVEIVGEAASQISAACRAQYAGIPWREVIAMRNRLVHAYFDVSLDTVWSTVTEDLPELVAELEKIAGEASAGP